MRTYHFILMLLLIPAAACAQTSKSDADRDKLIAASQSGASALFFDPATKDAKVIKPMDFDNAKECKQRDGLPNFFAKAKAKKPVTIGYIGGSITQSVHGYRASSARYIQSMFPKVAMKAINAGVSGTGTDLGACRLHEQLLQYHPDLIFIEFAVNGAYRDGLEGMIRQIRQFDPAIDIALLYTLFNGQSAIYAAGKVPENIAGFEAIADHYKIPSIHMGMQPAMLEQEAKLVWKSDSKSIPGKIVFSNDGIHPLTEGGDLYAGAIARSFEAMKAKATVQKHELPVALIADNWEDARMYAPEAVAAFSNGWEKIDPADQTSFKQFKGWFPYIMKATEPGSSFTFRFNGNMFGLFDIGGPEAGQLSIEVDGKPVHLSAVKPGTRVSTVTEEGTPLLNRFNNFCNNRYRGQFDCIKLIPGEHTVTITISPEKADKRAILGDKQLTDIDANPERYNQTAIWLGKILMNGKPL
ncbi:MAG: SGNH/GDSL hydrolase family protein [Pseudobacter sp.]|uniref:SGNH/GDSL hydrolase family protein n=1 Tax=Pseudobacter sp. TaxID=2045420 RepID=UPI003F803314